MAVPVLLVALTVVSIEATRWLRPRSPLFRPPVVLSLADAIATDDVQAAYEFLRAGQDPNELVGVSDPSLTDGRQVLVSPLVWAVAKQSTNSVLMLLGHGARMDRAEDRAASCLADSLGNGDIANALRSRPGAVAHEQCPKTTADAGAPLLLFVERAETLAN